MKLNRQHKMKLMDWFTKSRVVANQHIGTDGQYDLFVAPQVSVEWTPLTSVWLMQIDRDTDRNNTSFSPKHSTITYASWIVRTIRGIGSVMSAKTVITRGIGTYGQYSISIAAEYHHSTKVRFPRYIRQMKEIFENIKDQSSMKLERKLGINQKEERKLIGWNLELKKKRPLILLWFFFPQRRTRSAER